MKKKLLTSFEEHVEREYSKRGTKQREEFEKDAQEAINEFLARERRYAPRRKPGSNRKLTIRFK